MKRMLNTICLAACVLGAVLAAGTAWAQDRTDRVDVADLPSIADEALEDLRGGFFTVDGITFDFGAIVRTTVDGQPALETRLSWTPDGVMIQDLSTLTSAALPGTGGWGLDLSDASGMTLVGHRLLDGELQGFILNSGDNRSIHQSLEITLTLPGFDSVQRSILDGRLGMAIGMDVQDGLVRASSH
jgi:hypothetical protein